LASVASAQLLIYMGNPKLRGEHKGGPCAQTMGYKFAFIYPNGITRILSNEDRQLTLAFRLKLSNMRSCDIENAGQAARIPPLPRIGDDLELGRQPNFGAVMTGRKPGVPCAGACGLFVPG
jgi:hypothetical protein